MLVCQLACSLRVRLTACNLSQSQIVFPEGMYCRNLSQPKVMASASISTCVYLCSVAVIALEAYATGLH